MARVVTVAKRKNPQAVVKFILETSLLNEQEIITACRLAMEARADFVKTATGFGKGGATIENVILMRRTVGSSLGVKAAGGIRDLPTAMNMIKAGANRIGTSSGEAIMAEHAKALS